MPVWKRTVIAMKSDIEIAQAAQMQPITQIAEKLGLTED